MKVKVKKLSENAKLPVYSTERSACMDLYASVPENHVWEPVSPNRIKLIHTGVAMEIPDGYFGAIFARSGLATKEGLYPANCVGVIDSDYRGEIMVPLKNGSEATRYIRDNDRIAQMAIIPYVQVQLEVVDELDETERGSGGFGSTGKN